MRFSWPGKQKLLICFLALFLVAGLVRHFTSAEKPRDLNVVLITIDALRPDHLGCYGYRRNTSPNIDRLAREGTLFTQAISQASHTASAMGVVTTSAYSPINRLRCWGGSLNPDVLTFAETLKAHEYKTLFVGGNGYFREGLRGFDRGFDVFYEKASPASFVTQKALELLEKNASSPFFLWVYYMDAHDYTPEKNFESMFINDSYYDPQKKLPIAKPSVDKYGYNTIPLWLASKKGFVDNPDYYVALYDGGIRSVDEQIGRLLRGLKRLDGGRDTLIILTADHGESMGEHGYYLSHWLFVYEPLIKVPFILHEPGRIPSQKTDVQIRASLDIFPTILGFLGIKKPKTLEGVDLLPLLKNNGERPFSYVISDDGWHEISVRTNEWKLIRSLAGKGSPETYKLFHLKTDHDEMNDVSSSEKKVFALLKEKLTDYIQKYARERETASVLDEKTRKRLESHLRSLGYLQ